MAGKSTITVRILGDAKGLQQALATAASSTSKFASGIGKAMKIAGTAAAAGGVAAITAGFKGVGKALDFEKQMKEVFTLLPGISGKAMDKMGDQVKGFSTQFGVLPEEVVPALYESLSSGVPPDNVFEFLKTAQKAAVGGVTELETTVNGLTSVINAYGADTISAGQASDLMFEAVKLGKTTFDELSRSLFNVNPTAAALGVNFGDVTAALAAMTAQGTPTAVATTQLRQLFVELSKEGTKTSDTFKEIAGSSFKQFIAEGGNTQDALQLLEDHAKDTDVGINDLFSSVEAGNAALSLTGRGTDAFSKALDTMNKSTGSTDRAFKVMQKGLGPVIDRLKAFGQVALINIGEYLIPKIQQAIKVVEANWPTITKVFDRVRTAVAAAASWIVDNALMPMVDGIRWVINWVVDNWDQIRSTIVDVAGRVQDVLRYLGDAFRTAFQWLIDHKPVLIGVATAIGTGLVVAFGAWAVSAGAAAVATIAAVGPILLVGAAIAALVAGVIYAYQNWEWFRNAVDAVGRFLRNEFVPAMQAVWRFINEELVPAFQAVARFIMTDVIPAIQATARVIGQIIDRIVAFVKGAITVIQQAWDMFGRRIYEFAQRWWQRVYDIVRNVINIIRGIIKTVTSLIRGDWSGVWDGMKQIVQGAWNVIRTVISNALDIIKTGIGLAWTAVRELTSKAWDLVRAAVAAGVQKVVEFVRSLPGKVVNVLGNLGELLVNAGEALLRGLLNGAEAAAEAVWQWLRDLPSNIVNAVGDLASTLYQKGLDVIGGLINGITVAAIGLIGAIGSIPGIIAGAIGDLGSILYEAGRSVISGLISGVQSKIGELTAALNSVTRLIPNIKGPPAKDAVLLYENGQLIMSGFVRGIEDGVGPLVRALGPIGGMVVGGFEKVFEIASPSKVMAKRVGKPMAEGILEGLIAGLKKGTPAYEDALRRLAEIRAARTNPAVLLPSTNRFGSSISSIVDQTRGQSTGKVVDYVVSTLGKLGVRLELAEKQDIAQFIKSLRSDPATNLGLAFDRLTAKAQREADQKQREEQQRKDEIRERRQDAAEERRERRQERKEEARERKQEANEARRERQRIARANVLTPSLERFQSQIESFVDTSRGKSLGGTVRTLTSNLTRLGVSLNKAERKDLAKFVQALRADRVDRFGRALQGATKAAQLAAAETNARQKGGVLLPGLARFQSEIERFIEASQGTKLDKVTKDLVGMFRSIGVTVGPKERRDIEDFVKAFRGDRVRRLGDLIDRRLDPAAPPAPGEPPSRPMSSSPITIGTIIANNPNEAIREFERLAWVRGAR